MKHFSSLIAQFDALTDYKFDRAGISKIVRICTNNLNKPEFGKLILASYLRNQDLHFCAWCKQWFNNCGSYVQCDAIPETHGVCPKCRKQVIAKN